MTFGRSAFLAAALFATSACDGATSGPSATPDRDAPRATPPADGPRRHATASDIAEQLLGPALLGEGAAPQEPEPPEPSPIGAASDGAPPPDGDEAEELARASEEFNRAREAYDVALAERTRRYDAWRAEHDHADDVAGRARFAEIVGAPPADPTPAWIDAAKRFILAHPASRSAGVAMTRILRRCEQDRRFEDAVAVFNAVLIAAPESPAIAATAGDVEALARPVGAWNATAGRMLAHLAAAPRSRTAPALRLALADSLFGWNQPASARALCRAILELHPGTRSAAFAARRLWSDMRCGVGMTAPTFAATAADGRDASSAAFAGRFVVVVFWSLDRPLDLTSLPGEFELQPLLKKRRAADVAYVCVLVDPSPNAAPTLTKASLPDTLHVHDGLGLDGPLALAFGASRTPSNVVIGPDGRIVARDLWHRPQWEIWR